jgi:hypothetical protein
MGSLVERIEREKAMGHVRVRLRLEQAAQGLDGEATKPLSLDCQPLLES